MTDRATARHRAPLRPSTPLSTLQSAVSDQAGNLGRGGVVLAMSTGMIAAVGMPAQAAGNKTAGPEVATAGIAPASPVLLADSPFVATGTLGASPQLTAPAAATVSFDTAAFSVVPEAEPETSASDALGDRSNTKAGRSSVRSDLSSSFGSARGSSVVSVASRYYGTPYVFGGTTPSGFDCSGFVKYVYGQLGYSLPRTANDQMNAGTRISRSEAKPGDIVSFVSGGRAYHNGIYAGDNMIIDAPRTGKTVTKREIWSSAVVFTRVS